MVHIEFRTPPSVLPLMERGGSGIGIKDWAEIYGLKHIVQIYGSKWIPGPP